MAARSEKMGAVQVRVTSRGHVTFRGLDKLADAREQARAEGRRPRAVRLIEPR